MLLGYLKQHTKVIVFLTTVTAIFALLFSLYDLPLDAVLYGAALSLAMGLLLFALGFWQYVRRHRALQACRDTITVSLEGLPPPSGQVEQEYETLLRVLFEEINAVTSKADAATSDFVDYITIWAHQIKTPIAAMQLLLQSEENAQNAALTMELFKTEQYVNMVLQYLRMDSGMTDLVLRDYSLDAIIRQTLRKYAKLFILKKIELDFRETGLTIVSDEKWLCFVLEQLLSNSLKYTPSGKISISVQGTTLVIADTGIGIRSEDLPRVFERGYTGFNGRADKKSTGIGLFLCRRILDKLGHPIALTSTPGQGTQVTIDFGNTK